MKIVITFLAGLFCYFIFFVVRAGIRMYFWRADCNEFGPTALCVLEPTQIEKWSVYGFTGLCLVLIVTVILAEFKN